MRVSLSHARHLADRLRWSLRAPPPSAGDVDWATARLPAPLAVLWRAQHPLDLRHSVEVARWVEARAPCDAPSWLLPAALLHDVGKAGAHLGVWGRVGASLLEAAGVRRAPGRLGRYLRYPEEGAALLAERGAAPEVVAWAGEHHLPTPAWTLPPRWCQLLVEADEHAPGPVPVPGSEPGR